MKDYPLDAVKETIENELAHRDYIDNNIFINYKTIEISNPGALIASSGNYKFIKEKNPSRRNPWIYQKLILLDTKKLMIIN